MHPFAIIYMLMTIKLTSPDRYLQVAMRLFRRIFPKYCTNIFLKPNSLPHLPNLVFLLVKDINITSKSKPQATLFLIPFPSHIQHCIYLIFPSQKCFLKLSFIFNFCFFCLSSNPHHIYVFPAPSFSSLSCCHSYLARLSRIPPSMLFYLY